MKIVKVLALVAGLFGTSVPTTSIMMGGITVTAVTTLTAEPVQACDNSCQMANWQETREPFTGGTAPIFVDTCVRLLSTDARAAMTEVVLIAGEDPVNGRVITSLARGAGYAFKLANQPAGTEDIYVREFCFAGSLIDGLDAITFCNGITPGDGNHHTLSLHDDSAVYLRNLQRTGHVGDFLTLLGTERSYRAPVSTFFTATRYQQMF